MAGATREFVDGLCAGGPHPALVRTRAVIRLEVTDGPPGGGWTLVVADGRIQESDDAADADCVLRADAATLEGLATGRVNATAAILRGVLRRMARRMSWPRSRGCCRGRRDRSGRGRRRAARVSDGLVQILDGNTFVVSDERGDIEASPTDPTGLFSFDTRFLSQLGADRQRRAAERAVDRRPAVLRDAVLPRPGHRHRLRRREAVGDPAARGRRRLPRGADGPEPRRRSRSTSTVRVDADCDFADLFEVKDALPKKGSYGARSRTGVLRARATSARRSSGRR